MRLHWRIMTVMGAKKVLSSKSMLRSNRFSRGFMAFLLLGLGLHSAARLGHAWQSPDAAMPNQEMPGTARPAYPQVSLAEGMQLKYVGAVSADGKIRSKFGMFFSEAARGVPASTQPPPPVVTPESVKVQQDKILAEQDAVRKQVPPNIGLPQNEQKVEDFQPPEHAVDIAKNHSAIGKLTDSVVSKVYGATPVLVSPESVTTDSQQRVIITDDGAHAVHVLSHNVKHSFQIVGGPGRRLQAPRSVAVDGEDNIYVSDSKSRVILVYDSGGEFVRTIGTYGDEGLFDSPAGIAIDRKSGRLYVVDPPRHTLFIFDLRGFLLARVENKQDASSSRTGSAEPGAFLYPQSVVVHNDELVVLDATRIHILTLDGKFLHEFKVTSRAEWRSGPFPGLFLDAENHIYVSDPGSETVREYDHDGQLLSSFGKLGIGRGEFNNLAGMWADSTGHVYIADARRVQIFQLSGIN